MIEIYSKSNCPNCKRAVTLCETAEQPFTKYELETDYNRVDLIERCHPFVPRQLPQIFVNNIHLGGLKELDSFLKNA